MSTKFGLTTLVVAFAALAPGAASGSRGPQAQRDRHPRR